MFHKKIFKTIIPIIVLLAIFIGCGVDGDNPIRPKMTMTPGAYTSAEDVMAIIKSYGALLPRETQVSGILMAPSSGEWETSQLFNVKKEGQAMALDIPGVPKQVRLRVKEGALKKATEISMKVALEVIHHDPGKDELGSLCVTFGPSGTEFTIPAVLRLPFALLLTDGVDTFVITDEYSDEIDGVSYDIDEENHYLIAYIPHFSYYYFARR